MSRHREAPDLLPPHQGVVRPHQFPTPAAAPCSPRRRPPPLPTLAAPSRFPRDGRTAYLPLTTERRSSHRWPCAVPPNTTLPAQLPRWSRLVPLLRLPAFATTRFPKLFVVPNGAQCLSALGRYYVIHVQPLSAVRSNTEGGWLADASQGLCSR